MRFAICDLLTRNGLGCPSEWFQKPPVVISGAAKFDTFTRFVDKHQAEGIFGSKMSYDHRAAIDLYLRETVPGYCRLDDVLPGHRWVRLVRKDKILRAISLCRAECSGEWALKEDEHRKCPGFEYDFFHVLSRVMAILTGELAWDLYFQQHGITPCVIAYEDFFDDLEHQLPPLIDYLGGLPPGHALLQQSTQFRIQRNALNYRLRERFVFDLSRVYDPSLAEEVGAPWHRWKHFHSELQWRSQRHRAA